VSYPAVPPDKLASYKTGSLAPGDGTADALAVCFFKLGSGLNKITSQAKDLPLLTIPAVFFRFQK
jgi:hypothetical protein